MNVGKAAPGVEERADQVAEAACNLADTVSPDTWSPGAVEDAIDAIEALTTSLGQISPDATRILADVPAAIGALRRHLLDEDDHPRLVATVPAARGGRRRGLGHGWTGVRT
ncbi:hypothetical protein ACT1U9_32910 (plasmid) [Streptomyces sp. BR1]|uniref:hypothetical protein n=1 Tax=Streptomyces sp. BR1 TaxID=1592323 RepID=UPI00402B93F5